MLRLIEAPTSKPVTLAELKKHCRVDHDDDDDPLTIYLDAASEFVAARCSLALAPGLYRIERCDWWSGCLSVPIAPVREIVAVKYLDGAAVEHTVDPSLYRWRRIPEGAVLEALNAFTWPALASERDDAVTIELRAGFDDPDATGSGDDPDLMLPVRAKQAILLLAAAWYEGREAVTAGEVKTVPFAVDALLQQLRVYR